MNTVFGDTFFWLALVHPKDSWHKRVISFLNTFNGKIVTTDWVLMEVADALAGTAQGRREFISLHSDLHRDSAVTLIPCEKSLFDKAIRLYETRMDKEWSLTDCTSFVVMTELGMDEALTGDRHFEQAGFIALLK